MSMTNTSNPNSEIAIQVQGLTKSYGKVHALRGIDLQVQRGEIFGFLGPNGAGKTTTIRCMLDMIRPDGGKILSTGTGSPGRTGGSPGSYGLSAR